MDINFLIIGLFFTSVPSRPSVFHPPSPRGMEKGGDGGRKGGRGEVKGKGRREEGEGRREEMVGGRGEVKGKGKGESYVLFFSCRFESSPDLQYSSVEDSNNAKAKEDRDKKHKSIGFSVHIIQQKSFLLFGRFAKLIADLVQKAAYCSIYRFLWGQSFYNLNAKF